MYRLSCTFLVMSIQMNQTNHLNLIVMNFIIDHFQMKMKIRMAINHQGYLEDC
jgi:hypothetical protein